MKTSNTKRVKAWGRLYPASTRRLKFYRDRPFRDIYFNESVSKLESHKGDKIIPVTITYSLPHKKQKK